MQIAAFFIKKFEFINNKHIMNAHTIPILSI
jgi:hypothetical protein